jgi:hypothetical protein
MVALRTTTFNIKRLYVLPTECISVLRIVLRKTVITYLYTNNGMVCIIETQCVYSTDLTLSLLMFYIYGAPSTARNLTSYIYIYIYIYIWTRLFTGDFFLEPCISLMCA